MIKKGVLRNTFFVITVIFILNMCVYPPKSASAKNVNKNLSILVDLTEERLYLIDTEKNVILKKYSVASGKLETPSPIGTWKVVGIKKWGGGFGTRWIGLNVPWGKFGIHGTNKPGSIGCEASHGCIRMYNKDVEDLFEYVSYGMVVCIYAGPFGPFEKGFITLSPGDRGSAVLEVQRRLKDKGYYTGSLDGIYGDGMKRYVIKFREDNNLPVNHDIDYGFYKKLGIILMD